MKKIEISVETLRGVFLLMCELPYKHSGAEVYPKAIPIMNKAHEEIIELGKKYGFDNRGVDL